MPEQSQQQLRLSWKIRVELDFKRPIKIQTVSSNQKVRKSQRSVLGPSPSVTSFSGRPRVKPDSQVSAWLPLFISVSVAPAPEVEWGITASPENSGHAGGRTKISVGSFWVIDLGAR